MSPIAARLGSVILALALGCASTPGPLRVSSPGFVATDRLPGELLARQRISYRFGTIAGSLEAVLQVHCGEVVVMGLNPLGGVLFSIRQRGDVLEIGSSGLGLREAEGILLDVHRSFFYPVADPPLEDGLHPMRLGTVAYEERWAGGKLVERVIPKDGSRALSISFQPGVDARSHPEEVTLVDDRMGYRLDIQTRQFRRGPCEEGEKEPPGDL